MVLASKIRQVFEESIAIKKNVLEMPDIIEAISTAANMCVSTFKNRGAVYFCGNGGSAADAQHLAAELSGRFYFDRPPLNSEALHTNSSYLTAIANDYSYDEVYARSINGRAARGDVLFALSTSGNSKNVVRAVDAANDLEVFTIGMTGKGGGELKKKCRLLIEVPSGCTPRIQEAHILIGHILCEIVEHALFKEENKSSSQGT